jgi:hypothetical protein
VAGRTGSQKVLCLRKLEAHDKIVKLEKAYHDRVSGLPQGIQERDWANVLQ